MKQGNRLVTIVPWATFNTRCIPQWQENVKSRASSWRVAARAGATAHASTNASTRQKRVLSCLWGALGAARAPRRAPGGSLGSLRGARGPLGAPVRRLPSAWVAPVASERSSAATFGRERSREWLPKRPSASPRGATHTVKLRIFAGRLLAEVGVQGSPWAPGRRFQDP